MKLLLENSKRNFIQTKQNKLERGLLPWEEVLEGFLERRKRELTLEREVEKVEFQVFIKFSK